MTSTRAYRIERGSTTEHFHQSRAKFQFIGGGFGSGKTTAIVIKSLQIVKDYPGCNGLLARATYPKLNDTLRKEFFRWMPKHWQKSFNKKDNVLELVNGSVINFRYIAQASNEAGEGTSNLLSNTYDFIAVDQFEDPEINYKDFMDLVGRLRGSTAYVGDDPTMPLSGPRFFMFTANPTRNWLYRKVVKPVHDYQRGLWNPDLLCERDAETEQPILDTSGRPVPLISLYESSTYENRNNLPPDFLKSLEATYRGQMRSRFLLGQWTGYEGQVYSEFDNAVHVVPAAEMGRLYKDTRRKSNNMSITEAFDHGIAEPSCYIYAFADNDGNVHLMDGFYEAGLSIKAIATKIHAIRHTHNAHTVRDPENAQILGDPAIFRRSANQIVGPSVSSMLADEGVECIRANNALINGIAKVQAYMAIQPARLNPYTGKWGAPRIYVSDALSWWIDEIQDYVWMKDKADEYDDKPRGKKDHAMDTTRYLLTNEPAPSQLQAFRQAMVPAYMTGWTEPPDVRAV